MLIRALYKSVYIAECWRRVATPSAYVRDYWQTRGMDWSHDVHD
jgi:hypothetical protein